MPIAHFVTGMPPSDPSALHSIDALLEAMVARGASDLHLSVGTPPAIRVRGELERLEGYPALTPDDTQQLLYRVLSTEQQKQLEIKRQIDTSHHVPGLARFRVNVYFQREALGAAFRVIPEELKTLEELGLPTSLAELAMQPRGLVLVTGPTGSGKSTTLAAMIDEVNRNRTDHILTIEDPIEFVHRHKRCIVNQREIGVDATSFGEALRAALRQDPDVILVGEMRDLETIGTALTAAETGHLVLGTLHTQSAPGTVDRIIDVFPAEQQEQVRIMLAGSLQGIVTQALLPTADGQGRVAALEILLPDDATRNLIRQGKVEQIYSIMQTATGARDDDDGAVARAARPAPRDHEGRRARLLEPRRPARRPARAGRLRGRAPRRPPCGVAGSLTMSDDEKPTSIWKKEMSFRRKPAEEQTPDGRRVGVTVDSGPVQLAVEEGVLAPQEAEGRSGRARGRRRRAGARCAAVTSQPSRSRAGRARPTGARPDRPRRRACFLEAAPPSSRAEPVLVVEHSWLTKPLEEVSEPPEEPLAAPSASRSELCRSRPVPMRRRSSRRRLARSAELLAAVEALPDASDTRSSTRPSRSCRRGACGRRAASPRCPRCPSLPAAVLPDLPRRRRSSPRPLRPPRRPRRRFPSTRGSSRASASPRERKPKAEKAPKSARAEARAPGEGRAPEQKVPFYKRDFRSSAARRSGTPPSRPPSRSRSPSRRACRSRVPCAFPSLPSLPRGRARRRSSGSRSAARRSLPPSSTTAPRRSSSRRSASRSSTASSSAASCATPRLSRSLCGRSSSATSFPSAACAWASPTTGSASAPSR